TAGEIAAGSVTLTLTTAAVSGPCLPVSDQVTISILPAATVNAGADRTVCASSPRAQLAGIIGGGAANALWSGGPGSYAPSAGDLNAVYTPSAAEIAAGGVTLTLTTNDPAGPCGAMSDQMHVAINAAAVVDAGPDQTVCAANPRTQLQGGVSGGATGGTWSGGGGGRRPRGPALEARDPPPPARGPARHGPPAPPTGAPARP